MLHRDFLPEGAYDRLRSIILDEYEVGFTINSSPWEDRLGIVVNDMVEFWIFPDSILTFNYKEHLSLFSPQVLK